MPSVQTTGSPNIAILDSRIIASLCDGKFYVDISTSQWIADGKDSVLGANVQITNPQGVVIKPYGDNYEIAPAFSNGMDAVISFDVPTISSNYQYGKYIVDVKLFDADGSSWTVSKTVTICEPAKNKSYGSLSATLSGSCKDGKLVVITDTVPNYNGKAAESQVNDLTLEFPTSSGVSPLATTIGSFSVVLYEGVYKLTGEICATYNFTDYVFVKIKYKVKREKNIRCLVDECCVFEKLVQLHLRIKTNCTIEEREEVASITVDALRLLKTIQLAADCGEDASDYIEELEKLLKCSCTCNCAEGTPIINTAPARDFSIVGCGFEKSTNGLTDTYTLYNYEYVVGVVPNGGVLTISAASQDGCVKTQQITFSIAAAYAQIKNLANANNTEADFWASVVNKSLRDIDTTCLGIHPTVWAAYTFAQRWAAIVSKLCAKTSCSAEITFDSIIQSGADAIISWANSAGVFSVDIYLDGVLSATLLSSVTSYKFLDIGGGEVKEFIIIPKCSNGTIGTPYSGEIYFTACPEVAPPAFGATIFGTAECPFDLVDALALSGEYEVHNANNTLSSSLIGDPTQVNDGIYYVFNRVATGSGYCYSSGVKVTVICSQAQSCTAPQNLVNWITFGPAQLFTFDSAAYPPPGNSYTAKRRLASDPDVSGSYTILGTPTWDAGINKWVFSDSSLSSNVLYVYVVESNCGGSPASTPRAEFQFAKITCPSVSYDPNPTTIDYSFNGVGGSVDKYDVKIYDATGTSLLHTDTHTPAFPTPITGTFEYLTTGTTYKIRVRVWIGTYYKDCSFVTQITDGGSGGGSTELSVAYGTSAGDACGAPATVYIDSIYSNIQPGVWVFTDSDLGTLLAGQTYIANTLGEIFNMNIYGQVISTTGSSCS